ncbi:MAG: prolyl oligopeptidase family serine peptidase [Terricaulis sp.]
MAALGLLATLCACGKSLPAPPPAATESPLILRADLFGDAYRSNAQLSPRGDRVAFLAPRDGAANLFVLSVGAMDEPKPITDDKEQGINRFVWAEDSATLLYLQSGTAGEVRLYAVDAAGAAAPRALTPAGMRANILGLSASDPGGVLVELGAANANAPDVVRIDIAKGARTTIEHNPGAYAHYFVDHANRVRLALHNNDDGSAEMFARGDRRWTSLFTIPAEDTQSAQPIAFDADGKSFLMFDSTGRDRAALVRVDAATGVKTVLGESARADVDAVWLDPATNTPHAYAAEYLRPEWRALDNDGQADLDYLDRQLTGDFNVVSRSADNMRWIVVESGPTTSPRTYLYERGDNRRLSLLFRQRPNLEHAPLQTMTPVEIEARDGLTLVSYLTLPPGSDANNDARPEQPVPLVIIAHDGPWSRDSYGFDAMHQWLANRGYAVLSVNFRGSSGFGKAFLNAGNREWGGKVQDDLTDAVRWAVQNGIAQADHVAILGDGFGGFTVLNALSFTPNQYRCGVSYGAPANLASLLNTFGGDVDRRQLYSRIGDPRTADGRKILYDQSPIFRAGQIRNPLLLALGAHDPIATRGEADYIAQALRARGTSMTYLFFPEDGAALTHTPNRLAYLAVLEHFLGDCLGGRVEPVADAFERATMFAYEGAVNVPGLAAFARRLAAPAPASAPEPASLSGDGEFNGDTVSPTTDTTAATPLPPQP